MQGIAWILGGKGGGAGSGAPAGAAAEPPGRAQPVRAVPVGKGPLRGWVGGRVHGGGRCVEGRSPGGRCGRAGLGGAGGEAAGGWVLGEAGPQGRPGRRPGRRGRPQAAPESRPEGGLPCGPWGGVCRGRDGKAYHAPDGRQPGLQKTLHNFTKLSPVFTEDKKMCQVLFTICGYNGCQ